MKTCPLRDFFLVNPESTNEMQKQKMKLQDPKSSGTFFLLSRAMIFDWRLLCSHGVFGNI